MGSLVPFSFEGAEVRVVTRAGEPWFILADLCRVLEISSPTKAADRLDADEKEMCDVSLHTGNIQGATINGLACGEGNNSVWVVSESGLYSLILTSRKDAAKRFKKWITGEVLPAIRKTGGYMMAAPDETPEALALRALQVLQATVQRQKEQLAEVLPKAAALERIAEPTRGSVCITDAAKALQIAPKALFGYLTANGWIYRRAGAAGYVGYQAKTNAGMLEHKVTTVQRQDGTEKMVEQVLVTPKGLARLAESVNAMALN